MSFPVPNPPTPGSNPYWHASDLVYTGWGYFQGLSNELLAGTLNTLGDMRALEIQPITWSATWDQVFEPSQFIRPISPGDPPAFGEITTTVPDAPTLEPISVGQLPAAPTEPNFGDFGYSPPGEPGTGPTDPNITTVVLDEILIPDAPVLPDIGELPELYTITMPESIPDVSIEAFDASNRPTINFTAPSAEFTWQEDRYTADLALSIKDRISLMLIDGTGLPVSIEQAIFARAREREEKASSKLVSEITDEFATRGFTEPNGILARRILEARQANRSAVSGHIREVAITRFKEEIEQLKFACAQGIACESLLIEQSNAYNNRALEAAKIAVDLHYRLFEARVALHNSQLEAFKVDAEVYVQRIRAIQAQVEIYKAQIEAEKVKGDVNEALIRAYTETIRARDAMVQVYRTQMEAARIASEINTQRLETTRVQVQVFAERVRAHAANVDAYRATVEGRLGSVRAMESMAAAYGSRVQAHRANADILIEQARVDIAGQEAQVSAFNAAINAISARIRAEAEAAQVAASNYRARADIYSAEGNVSASEAAAYDRAASIRIAGEQARIDTILKNAELQINQLVEIAKVMQEGLRGRAQAQAQLAASVLSGVNLSAGISGSAGLSESVSYSYSGEI